MEPTIETERLVLRPWAGSDAASLYRYAKDPAVGTPAGWPPHASVEESRDIIRTVFSAPGIYAVVLKSSGEVVGCCGLVFGSDSHVENIRPGEAEIGYWIGVPYWGQGLIPEAVKAVLAHGFRDLGLTAVWLGHYDANSQSRRVAEKCGFRYDHTVQSGDVIEHFWKYAPGETDIEL